LEEHYAREWCVNCRRGNREAATDGLAWLRACQDAEFTAQAATRARETAELMRKARHHLREAPTERERARKRDQSRAGEGRYGESQQWQRAFQLKLELNPRAYRTVGIESNPRPHRQRRRGLE
jgi:hypothetical protein